MHPSLAHSLASALAQESDKEALVLIGPSGTQRATRAEVDAHARYSAQRLIANGVKPGDVILMLMEHAYESLPIFIGALYMGAVPMVLPYLTPQTTPAQQGERLAGLVRFFQPKAIITLPRFHAELMGLELPATTLAWDFQAVDALSVPAVELSTRQGEELAYLLYTSGTTGQPKAVMVPHRLVYDAAVIADRRRLREHTLNVAAAPLSHITGLVGAGFGNLIYGITAVIISPSYWAQHPAIFFQTVHQYRASSGMLTNTGLQLSLQRVQPQEIEGIDLSCLRMLSSGGELVWAATLEAFAKRFAPYGFQASALLPSYSSSECYSVMSTPGRPWRADWISTTVLMREQKAMPVAPGDPDGRAVVSLGTALPGTTVQIRDEDDNVLPERALGEIVVKTPLIFSGYWKQPQLTEKVLRGGWYYTGDMGYFVGDELYVIGRLKDLIIVGGRNVLPDAIEEQVLAAGQGQLRSAVAFGIRDEALGTEQPVVVCEMAVAMEDEQRQQLAQVIRTRVRKMVDVALADLRFVESGWIVRAGIKLARNANRDIYLAQFRPVVHPNQEVILRTPTEEVRAIFAEVLGQPEIGEDHNFYDLGGDSISALKMLMLVEKRMGRSVPPEFFQRPTVAHLVNLLDNPNAAKGTEAAKPLHYDDSAFAVLQRPKPPVKPERWTRQHIRRATRWRLIDSAFRLPYFEAMTRLAGWSSNRLIQNALYPQEVQLFRRFCASLGRANADNEQFLTCSLMSHILMRRLGVFYDNDKEKFIQRMQNSRLTLVREIGQALAEPHSGLSRQIFTVQGSEHLEAALQQGRGVILVTFHNTSGVLGMPALLKRTEPIYWLSNQLYHSIYQELYGSGSPQDFADQMPFLRTTATQRARNILLAGGIVVMAVDFLAIKHPVYVPIGDKLCPLPTGFAELALATNAAIIPTYAVMQTSGKITQYIHPRCNSGDASFSHNARVESLTHQAGAFIERAWHDAPSVLDWGHMRHYVDYPQVQRPPAPKDAVMEK